jgi:hypothetical protein
LETADSAKERKKEEGKEENFGVQSNMKRSKMGIEFVSQFQQSLRTIVKTVLSDDLNSLRARKKSFCQASRKRLMKITEIQSETKLLLYTLGSPSNSKETFSLPNAAVRRR